MSESLEDRGVLRSRALLEAGALLPLAVEAPEGVGCVEVSARRYHHPALEEPVVCLTEGIGGESLDLEMTHMGFEVPEVVVPVARASAGSVGYLAWVLANDPSRAEAAAALAAGLPRLRHLAIVRPERVLRGYEVLAESLAVEMPSHLPAFWESAGRTLIGAGSLRVASQCFGKAREAERTHDLLVDEGAQQAAFVEFALQGALPAKALEQYARDLEARREPPEAYEIFRSLCVRRTLGGLPPDEKMGRVFRRLLKVSGRHAEAETHRFLRELLDAPALVRAPLGFWKGFGWALLSMVASDRKVGRGLLELMPDLQGGAKGGWLEFLDEIGVLDALVLPALQYSEAETPVGGASGWLERFNRHSREARRDEAPPTQVFSLLEKMAPRLIEDGVPVCLEDRGGHIDLDLLDLALCVGIPVVDPSEGASLLVEAWLCRRHQRDPVGVSSDARFEPLMDRALEAHLRHDAFQKVLREMKGFESALSRYLRRRLDAIMRAALPGAAKAVEGLGRSAGIKPEHWQLFPDLRALLGRADLASVLARTLRGGVVDELGWPALDKAIAGRKSLEVGGAFPVAVLWDGVLAEAVGPDEVLTQAAFQAPAWSRLIRACCVEGRILMIWHAEHGETLGVWSDAPDERFAVKLYEGGLSLQEALEVPGGGITFGGEVLRAGARGLDVGGRGRVVGDGERFWVMARWSPESEAFWRLDPRTGVLTASDPPDFFDVGATLWREAMVLRPLPEGVEGSLLGARGGLTGWRAHVEVETGGLVSEGIDGRHWEGFLEDSEGRAAPCGLVEWPGDGRHRPLSESREALKLWDPTGRHVLARFDMRGGNEASEPYALGTLRVLPSLWWHLLKPRDPEGSAALRGLDDGAAVSLLEAARLDEVGAVARAVRLVLPEIAHPRLIEGVVGVVRHAAQVEASLAVVRSALAGLDEALSPRARTERFFHVGSLSPVGLEAKTLHQEMVGRVGAVAFESVMPGLSESARAASLAELESWAASCLSSSEVPVRAFEARFESLEIPFAAPSDPVGAWGVEIEGRRYGLEVWETRQPQGLRCRVVEWAPEGDFATLPGMVLIEQRISQGWGGSEAVRRFVAEARSRGPLPWSGEIVAEIARRTGLSRAAASLLWAGCPGLKAFGKDYLGERLRKGLGLTVAEALEGKKALLGCSSPEIRARVWHEAMPEVPAALWAPLGGGVHDDESPVARLCAAWNAHVGRRAPVPEGLVRDVDKLFGKIGLPPGAILGAVAEPERSGHFNRDARSQMTARGQIRVVPPDPVAQARLTEGHFGVPALTSLAHILPWLFLTRPVGDPLRQNLPRLAELAWKRLRHPDLLLLAGTRYFYGDFEAARACFDAYGGDPYELLAVEGGEAIEARDMGSVVAALIQSRGAAPYAFVSLACRPGQVLDFESLRDQLDDPFGARHNGLDASRLLLSGGFAALVDRLRHTPVPQGQYEANPAHSAPELVGSVQRTLSLSEDAAVLYLQTLTLAEPSAANIELWNAWDRARTRAAADALVGGGLLVREDRPGAGRRHFVSGEWTVLKAPCLSMESSKLSLYGIEVDGASVRMPLRRVLPLKPVHVLFQEAWRVARAVL